MRVEEEYSSGEMGEAWCMLDGESELEGLELESWLRHRPESEAESVERRKKKNVR